jgi:hypothetical protein
MTEPAAPPAAETDREVAERLVHDFTFGMDSADRLVQRVASALTAKGEESRAEIEKLKAELKGTEAATQSFAEVYTILKGFEPVDSIDASPNWWMFFKESHAGMNAIGAALRKSRGRAEASEDALVRMRTAGGLLANIAFNLAQSNALDENTRRSLKDAQSRWDAVRSEAIGPAPSSEPGERHDASADTLERAAACYECGGALNGPYCPACNSPAALRDAALEEAAQCLERSNDGEDWRRRGLAQEVRALKSQPSPPPVNDVAGELLAALEPFAEEYRDEDLDGVGPDEAYVFKGSDLQYGHFRRARSAIAKARALGIGRNSNG